MNPQHLLIAILSLVFTASIALHAQDTTTPQSWTASDGRVIQAKFIKLDGESVVIEKDGQQFAVAFAKLAPASVAQAKKLGGVPDSTPPPSAPATPAAEFQKWKTSFGTEIEARYDKTNGNTVEMIQRDGKMLRVTLDYFDAEGAARLSKLSGLPLPAPKTASSPAPAAALADDPDFPTWTPSYNIQKPFQAKFVKFADGMVELTTKENGGKRTMSLSSLDDKSAAQALRLAGLLPPAPANATPKPMIAPPFDKPKNPPLPSSPVPDNETPAWLPDGWEAKSAGSRYQWLDDDGGLVLLVNTGAGHGLIKIAGTDGKPAWNVAPAALDLPGYPQMIGGRDHRVFVTSSRAGDAGSDVVIACVSTTDGKVLWKQTYDGPQKGVDRLGTDGIALDREGNLVALVSSGGVPPPPDPKKPVNKVLGLQPPRGSTDSIVLTYAAADGKLLHECKSLAVPGSDEYLNNLTMDAAGHLIFSQTVDDMSQGFRRRQNLLCFDAVSDKVIWQAALPAGLTGSAQETDAAGTVVMPSRNASSYGLFSAMAFSSDGKKTLDLTLPEVSARYPIGIVAGTDLICVAGASRQDGAMIFRAYGRSDGKLRWQKDDILSAAAHVSKDNNKDYFDHVLLADKQGNVFLGWTQPKDDEYQIVLAKFSPQGEVLWVQWLANQTAPISAGLHNTLSLDEQGNPVLIYEQAHRGSKLQNGALLADFSITKKNVWTIDKFDGATGHILWQYARKGIVDQEEYTGYGSKLIHDKEGNVTFVWSLSRAPNFSVIRIAAKEGTALWETKIGK